MKNTVKYFYKALLPILFSVFYRDSGNALDIKCPPILDFGTCIISIGDSGGGNQPNKTSCTAWDSTKTIAFSNRDMPSIPPSGTTPNTGSWVTGKMLHCKYDITPKWTTLAVTLEKKTCTKHRWENPPKSGKYTYGFKCI